MLRSAEERSGGCPNDSRTKRCLICDNKWEIDKKLNRLSRWGWRPRTWIKQAVIILSMLNVVFAHLSVEPDDESLPMTNENGHYTSQWAVRIEGGPEAADRIASRNGFVNLGKIFGDFYHFEHKRLAKRSLIPHPEHQANLVMEAQVKWAQQQRVKRRTKRDLLTLRPKGRSSNLKLNDVEWPQMWYLNRGQGLDMNVQGAWQEGISGSGVVVTILDDGLEKTHPDLVANYDPQASYDVNNHDEDPMPRYDPIDSNRHGTRCAGEVAAVANNSLCSVGVAFGASVGGVRMLDGDVTDAVEARSLSLNPQHIDIYSASWGPDDDGKTVDGPGELATRAFIEGVTKGRQGKGSIFVWASGNGGREHDNCNCDGYTNSIWTLSISSATENGFVPWYSEACSSTLATTYSSGSAREKQIVTTDLRHKCTNGHTGTSASAPLAAGICALALEANRDLTWRDMQHIVVRTAKPANLKSSDWKVNGVGRNVSHSFGYGLMDASAMVKLARTWKTVPEQHRCEVSAPHVDKLIPARSKVILSLNVTECPGVNFLEHVQAKISLSSPRRGDLQIYLTSPAGTRSTLLARRPQDSSRNPFNAWPFMSVHTWGEMPFGIWQLEIHNEGRYLGRANLQEWSLLFYGTSEVAGSLSEKNSSKSLSTKSFVDKTNAIHVNSKSNKNTFASQNNVNRKNSKSWKGKSTTSRIGKISGGGVGVGTRVVPTASSKSGKTIQKSGHFKIKDSSPGRGIISKTTSPPLSSHTLPLTIVLRPSGNFTNYQKVPDVFQKYPKVQQLFPIYVNTGRVYNDENFLLPKIELTSPYLSKSHSKSKSYLTVQKTERQNRFDTSSLTRTSTEGKIAGTKNFPSRNHQIQGHFEGWRMLFYGTEDTPNGGDTPDEAKTENGNNKMKNVLSGKVNLDDVSNHLEPESSNRVWKDQATRRDDMMRTTADPLAGPSSGCISLSKSTSHCIECVDGLYLYGGHCEAICPPRTYPGINSKEKAACLPCHYTCLTCAGESDGHCTMCHDEAVPVPSGLKESIAVHVEKHMSEVEETYEGIMTAWKPEVKVENLSSSGEDSHLSWGKRSFSSINNQTKLIIRKKAVTKKILEPYDNPRRLFYCYPSRMLNEIGSSATWYYRMSVLFAVNLVLLLGFFFFFLWKRFCGKKALDQTNHPTYKYLKASNGDPVTLTNGEHVLYLSTSSDEDELYSQNEEVTHVPDKKFLLTQEALR